MSEQSKTRPEVPEGKARFVTTRQKKPNEKGFVGYETIRNTWNLARSNDRLPANNQFLV